MDPFGENEFAEPDDLSDIVLLVEDCRLYTHKVILATASPVWKRMFLLDFCEKDLKEIPLPGKRLDDMLELLRCIYPSIRKPVYDKNVLQILPLADEYQMLKLKEECEDLLLSKVQYDDAQPKQYMPYMVGAQRYNMKKLLERCIKLAASLPLSQLRKRPEYEEIEPDTLTEILQERVVMLEKNNADLIANTESYMRKVEQLENQLFALDKQHQADRTRVCSDLLAFRRELDVIKGAWELKGNEARCNDPIHMYGERDYSCTECNRAVRLYAEQKHNELIGRMQTLLKDVETASSQAVERTISTKSMGERPARLLLSPGKTDS